MGAERHGGEKISTMSAVSAMSAGRVRNAGIKKEKGKRKKEKGERMGAVSVVSELVYLSTMKWFATMIIASRAAVKP